jgi:hypothetical protein
VLAPALSLRTRTGCSRGGRWELGESQVDQLDQVVGAAGGGVAWAQQAGQRLAGRLAAVQVGQQRVKAERSLVGALGALFGIAVGQHQGRVRVYDQQLGSGWAPAAHARARAWALAARSLASPCASSAARSMTRQAVGVEATGPNSSG